METLDITEKQHAEVTRETPEVELGGQHTEQKKSEALVSDEQKMWTALAEPPDIDYRMISAGDQERIDWLLIRKTPFRGEMYTIPGIRRSATMQVAAYVPVVGQL